MNTQSHTEIGSPTGASPSGLTTKSLDALIAEQGVANTSTFQHILGRGAELWDDDAAFESFLERMRAIRKEQV